VSSKFKGLGAKPHTMMRGGNLAESQARLELFQNEPNLVSFVGMQLSMLPMNLLPILMCCSIVENSNQIKLIIKPYKFAK